MDADWLPASGPGSVRVWSVLIAGYNHVPSLDRSPLLGYGRRAAVVLEGQPALLDLKAERAQDGLLPFARSA